MRAAAAALPTPTTFWFAAHLAAPPGLTRRPASQLSNPAPISGFRSITAVQESSEQVDYASGEPAARAIEARGGATRVGTRRIGAGG
jgi:hypothetical protein